MSLHHHPTIIPPSSHHHPTIIPPSSHHHPTIIPPSSHHQLTYTPTCLILAYMGSLILAILLTSSTVCRIDPNGVTVRCDNGSVFRINNSGNIQDQHGNKWTNINGTIRGPGGLRCNINKQRIFCNTGINYTTDKAGTTVRGDNRNTCRSDLQKTIRCNRK